LAGETICVTADDEEGVVGRVEGRVRGNVCRL
jgi:hypothetical protein